MTQFSQQVDYILPKLPCQSKFINFFNFFAFSSKHPSKWTTKILYLRKINKMRILAFSHKKSPILAKIRAVIFLIKFTHCNKNPLDKPLFNVK